METSTQGERQATTEAEVGARPWQAKEPPGLPAVTRIWKRQKRLLPRVSEGGWLH